MKSRYFSGRGGVRSEDALLLRGRHPHRPGITIQEAAMISAIRPTGQATSIQLRSEDLDFLFTQVSEPDLHTRNVDGFDNNLTPGRASWGTAEQPFLRLAPAQFDCDDVARH